MFPQRGRGRGTRGRKVFKSFRTAEPTPTVSTTEYGSGIILEQNASSQIDINLELDERSSEFFTKLKNMWNLLKNSPPVVSLMQQYFNEAPNPFEDTLRLMYNCQGFSNPKNKTLPFFIIEELGKWCTNNKEKSIEVLTPSLKLNAFNLITQQNSPSLTKLVVNVFQMVDDSEVFLSLINRLLKKKNYKDACQYAILFKLQDKFKIEDFLLPLILQDKLSPVYDFLATSPPHQTELVVFLDSILGKSSVKDALSLYATNLDVPDVKVMKLLANPLKKLLTKMIKSYDIPESLTPNLNRRRNKGALYFLLHKRFVENSFSDESWREMVQEAVRDDTELQRELVNQVAFNGDNNEALKWANFYNVDKQYWPTSLLDNPTAIDLQEIEDTWGDDFKSTETQENLKYHKFSLPIDRIILIDNEVKLSEFIENILGQTDIVGIDCEWKPNFAGQGNELALMQIATRDSVYIVDVLILGPNLSHLWKRLGEKLFYNGDILKLAFGFSSDITMLHHILPDLHVSYKSGFIDLLTVWKHLDKYPTIKLPYDSNTNGTSFSSLVQQCFDQPLDKSDQFSNWEKRPLRESQLIYAANDAYSLIEVFDVIQKCCENAGTTFDDLFNHIMSKDRGHYKRRNKKPSPKKHINQQHNKIIDIPQPPCPYDNRIPVSSFRVVCDTMLQGLGKNLRRCGANTIILDNNMDHMTCIMYAQTDARHILTRGSVFNKLYRHVPPGNCYKVQSENVDEQLKEVLNYYKVDVTKSDVFSVCQACNGDSYVELSYSKIMLLKQTPSENYQLGNYGPAGFSSDDNDDDDDDIDDDDFGPSAPLNNREWNLESWQSIDMENGKTRFGATIQVDAIPEGILTKMDTFYVCEKCGKVYWDGSHFNRVVNGRLQGIVQ